MTIPALSCSLISSYTTAGIAGPKPLAGLLQPYAECRAGVELYLFMEPDCRHWLREWHQPEPDAGVTAVEFLANLNDGQLDDVVQIFRQRFLLDLRLPIVAFASFIPEVACDIRSQVAERARSAISSLIKLAQRLADASGEVPSPVIEIVAGSRVAALDTHDPGEFKANLITDDAGRANVLRNVELALGPISILNPNLDTRIALELEPGPLYLLRDLKTLRSFGNEIAANPLLNAHVGFNLDIAHWRMADIKPEGVVSNPLICDRLFHAHIAGHHRCGHFGDTGLLELNTSQEFEPWLRLLRTQTGSRFSGYVSLEFEAAKDLSFVIAGLRHLKEMLNTP